MISDRLECSEDSTERGKGLFKQAVEAGFVRGRSTEIVASVCLYTGCRITRTPHLLLDFSEVMKINVYSLGRVFLRLVLKLKLKSLPLVDPCLYIDRFAKNLELGEKTHDVGMLALRLVARMKRDWIHVGRRPAGLCGAGKTGPLSSLPQRELILLLLSKRC